MQRSPHHRCRLRRYRIVEREQAISRHARRSLYPRIVTNSSTAARRRDDFITFCVRVLEGIDVHRLVSDDPLKPCVFFFELPQALQIADFKAAVFAFQLRRILAWMPCRRQISAIVPVAPCSSRIATIWASVKRDFRRKGLLFRSILPQRPHFHLDPNQGARPI